ncbi:BsuBI/PstI family type II restriction endonuclease [Azospirillum agricola]|uniref:BsuBI/PstI family type II restriction endonuclease n=1 Tax=Azospirillum agricola TaxID=1720247 RepID=UPI000A0F304A|nr:BsuBI/PstI family type II restriction endonuclease [Azospirillum agricola]SMH52807.1 DNA-methyltransferase (dcm) [Azospirillum lipoferum]
MKRLHDLPASKAFGDTRSWLSWLHDVMPEPQHAATGAVVMDLFAGCGGLALGFEAKGFLTSGYEMKPAPVATYNANLGGRCEEMFLTVGMPEGRADVVIGGPPCQPFSQIGYQRGKGDKRDGFPVFLDAVNRVRPKIAIIENVRGLLFRNKDYLHQAVRELERFGYTVDARLLNAADYGVPQKRERVVVVASKVGWEWPEPVVSTAVTAGVALGPLARAHDAGSRFLTPSMDRYIAAYEEKSHCVRPRDLRLDQPSRTVTCRNLGGATSDMLRIRLPDGRRRMLTVREAARLQSFPDWFRFEGTEYDQHEQIGNAVPPLLALAVAGQVKKFIDRAPNGTVRSPSKGGGMQQGSLLEADPVSIKVEQALNIMRAVGVPVRDMTPRRRERVALALLAVAHVPPAGEWVEARCFFDGGPKPVTSRQIIGLWNRHYGQQIADSSYDGVRKDLVFLVEAGLVAKSAANPAADTNDGTRGYSVHEDAIALLRSYGAESWENELVRFRSKFASLSDRLSKAREYRMVPVTLPDGKAFKLSPGPHNLIQKAVIEDFLPRFSKGAQVLYLGDTEKKILHVDEDAILRLGLPKPSRAMLPDILAYEAERNWLFLIEAVHSSNPISELRHMKLQELTQGCTAGCVYVSAFESLKTFARFAKEIGWETEVWVADNPGHMIHFNGDRFMGPHERT